MHCAPAGLVVPHSNLLLPTSFSLSEFPEVGLGSSGGLGLSLDPLHRRGRFPGRLRTEITENLASASPVLGFWCVCLTGDPRTCCCCLLISFMADRCFGDLVDEEPDALLWLIFAIFVVGDRALGDLLGLLRPLAVWSVLGGYLLLQVQLA